MHEFLEILPGVSSMMNIHPMLIHFPIALLSAFLAMELLGFIFKKEDLRTAATWMLYLGTLGAMVAVAAGLYAASTVSHSEEVHPIILKHRNLGITVLSLGVILSIWRIMAGGRFTNKGQLVHLFLALVMVIAMTFGADLGGLMVYKYGVAVRAVPQPKGHLHGGMMHEEEPGGHLHEGEGQHMMDHEH
ncbi:MAG: DUF2231 domain-containing protein [Deltaproteobacteria bacterium]|nr:DUF2231 domain-containing protein [Deltaproteobacteria bacterium]